MDEADEMSGFTSILRVQRTPGVENWRRWKLIEAFAFVDPRTGEKHTVPAGFITDGASIPRIFWILMTPTGPYMESAVIHDFLYRTAPFGIDEFGRNECDRVFLQAMEVQGIRRWRRRRMYDAVHRFGGRTKTWKAHRQE